MSHASHDWLSSLDGASEVSSNSDVNTELLQEETPFMSSPSKTQLNYATSIPSPPSRLELETDLSVSSHVSIPNHNPSNYNGLFDTVDLLQGRTQNDDTINSREISIGSKDTSSPKYANTSHISPEALGKSVDVADLNQVPPRFSLFIMEQNNCTSGAPTASSMMKHSRDISDLMGSQATIFSTRLDSSPTMRSRFKSRSRRSRAYPESSSVHLLTRQKAIRFKEGSLVYRFKLRMKKIVAKMKRKFAPMWNFVAGSKKATSTVKMPHKKSKRTTLLRPKRTEKTMVISAPITNPNLGQGTHKTSSVPGDKSKMLNIYNEQAGKMNQLSNYISEQRHLGIGPSQAAFQVDSMAPPPPPHLNSLGLKHYLNNPLAEAQKEKVRVQALWRQYLAGVLAQRIKLRQEITLFQMLLANQSVPSIYRKQIGDISSSQNASILHVNPSKRDLSQYSVTESLVSVTGGLALEDEMSAPEIESDLETLDLNVEKLQQLLNRRSMLGEMLDYESDQLSSSGSTLLANSDMASKYGTLKRYANIQTRSKYSDYELGQLPRSQGYNQDLHLATV